MSNIEHFPALENCTSCGENQGTHPETDSIRALSSLWCSPTKRTRLTGAQGLPGDLRCTCDGAIVGRVRVVAWTHRCTVPGCNQDAIVTESLDHEGEGTDIGMKSTAQARATFSNRSIPALRIKLATTLSDRRDASYSTRKVPSFSLKAIGESVSSRKSCPSVR